MELICLDIDPNLLDLARRIERARAARGHYGLEPHHWLGAAVRTGLLHLTEPKFGHSSPSSGIRKHVKAPRSSWALVSAVNDGTPHIIRSASSRVYYL